MGQADAGEVRKSADQLDRIVLNISPNQLVGVPLKGVADVLLFDTSNALLTSYNLVDSPIVLSSQNGSLTPNTLDNQSWFDAGMIDLITAGVVYDGPTGSTELTAQAIDITSLGVVVNFSGYDLNSSTFTDGSPISEIFLGLPTSILVSVQNKGNLLPLNGGSQDRPFVRTYFTSGGGSVKRYYDGVGGGVIDTLSILLPDVTGPVGQDTLVVGVVADFLLNDTVYQTTDSVLIPVNILPTPSIVVLPGTVTPDSVYTGIGFTFGFDVQAENLITEIDSTSVTARLVNEQTGAVATTLVSSDTLVYVQPEPSLLQYRNIVIPAARVNIDSGWYRVEFDYALYAGAQSFVLNNIVSDSMWLVLPGQMELVPSTLAPLEIIGGTPVSFGFDVNLIGSNAVQLVGNRTTFSVESGAFSSTVSLRAAQSPIQPGTNRLISDSVTVPVDLAPALLNPDAVITFRRPGFGNSITLETDFNQQQISVLRPISIQLISTTVTGIPNAPFVNCLQPLQILAQIANPSERAATSVTVRLHTEGGSQLVDSVVVLDSISARDTVEVLFAVTAAAVSTASETFMATVTTASAEVLPPLDNSATVTIQTPADLRLNCSLSGLTGGYVRVGQRFALLVSLNNSGEAAISEVLFRMRTNGVNLGVPNPLLGSLVADSTVNLLLTAPAFDTIATIMLSLLELPLDLNTGLPALIGDTACTLSVLVSSLQPDLVTAGSVIPGNIVRTGADNDLFTLSMKNLGRSARATIQIDKITLRFYYGANQPAMMRDILEVGSSGFVQNDHFVSTSSGGNNILETRFDDYLIPQGDSVALIFRARIKEGAPGDFQVRLLPEDIAATYTSGPLAGDSAPAVTSDGDSVIVGAPISAAPGGAASFTVRDNPFNPHYGPALFTYTLAELSRVEFRVLTLTGEIVYEKILTAGDEGTEPGGHELQWDGCNSNRDLVLNGVYLAILSVDSDGSRRVIKVAVVK
jgi:hypothetical protein